MAQYGTIITNIGLAQIANAQVTQTKVGLDYIALGDGNGAHYVPTQSQTALVREVWRGPIAELSIDPTNSNRIIIDAVIPVTAGGFTIREIGIFDDKNQLIAVGQYPEKYKPELSEGVSEETLIHFVIETNNADVVKLTIDPTVIIASRKYVDEKVAGINKGLTEITQTVTELETEFTAHKDDYIRHTQLLDVTYDDSSSYLDFGGTLDGVTELYDGLSVTFKVPYTSADDKAIRFNLNNLGAKAILSNRGGITQNRSIEKNTFITLRYSSSYNFWIYEGFNQTPEDSGQITLQFGTGWTLGTGVSPMLRRYGHFVFVRVAARPLTTSSSTTILTIPSKYKPSEAVPVLIFGIKNGNAQIFDGILTATGSLMIVGTPISQLSTIESYYINFGYYLHSI